MFSSSRTKASRSSGRTTSRFFVAAVCMGITAGIATAAMGAGMTSELLIGRWAMNGMPAEAGDAMTTVIQDAGSNQLKITPPRDLASATGGTFLVKKTGEGKYTSLDTNPAKVTITFQSPRAARLEIVSDRRGEKANYSIDLVHLN